MFRTALLVLLVVCSAPAAAEVVVPVTIGGKDVRLAVDDDAVRMSEKLPTNFAVTQAGLPPTNRLVEGFVSEADAKKIAVGETFDDVSLQVQVMRNAEALDFSAADWAQLLPVIRTQMGGLDLDTLVKAQDAEANQRMSGVAGAPVKREFGVIGKPIVYGQDAQSLRFMILIPATYQVNGVSNSMTLESAGAILRLNGKLVYLYAYRRQREGEAGDLTAVRTVLDHFADRAIALNNTDAAPARASVTTPPAVTATSR